MGRVQLHMRHRLTTAPAPLPAVPRAARVRSLLRGASLEERLFGISLIILALHLAGIALEGLSFGAKDGRASALVLLALLPLCFALFMWRGRVVRALLAAGLGLSALILGLGVYFPHLVLGQVAGSDFTGLLWVLAGILLLWLAVRIGLRGRSRLAKAIAIPLLLFAIAQWVVYPTAMAAWHVNTPRPAIPAASTLGIPGAADVTFPARSGVRLAAWYVPGSNGAAVILLHGTGGSRLGTLEHLRMLAGAGYAVLALDARGHGHSEGQPNSWGWPAADSLAGAVAFLHRQPGVDPGRIAALGLSTGAIEALRAAAEGVGLRAVVADGCGPLTLGDEAVLVHGWKVPIDVSATWVTMRLTTFFTGDAEPAPLIDTVSRLRVPVMLIAANPAIDPALGHPPGERVLSEVYRERIGANATLWYVGDVGHCEALHRHPREYRDRVTAFLAAALGLNPRQGHATQPSD
jgi:pimeloyl-ACP methyl ester carboxylesterase